MGGSEGEGETYSPLPHHSLCLPGQSCATYAPNFGMGGLEREEEKTHSSLPLHFSRLPGQNCSTHNRKVQFGWLRGGGEVIHPHLFFIATPDLHPLPSYFTGPRLAPAPLFLPAGSKLRDLCPNKHSTLGALEQEEEKTPAHSRSSLFASRAKNTRRIPGIHSKTQCFNQPVLLSSSSSSSPLVAS